MKPTKFNNDLTQGSVTKQLLRFSLPFLASNLLQALYNVADMYVVGRFCDSSAISGVSIGGQFTMLILNIVAGLSIGGQVLIAQYNGAKMYDAQRRTIGTMLTLYIFAAAIMTTLMLVFSTPLLHLINTPAESFAQAQSYMNICMGGIIFIFGYNAISAILRGMGDSKRPLVFVAIATVINIVLDIVFVGPLGMEAAGAALATVIAQAVSFILSIIYLARQDFIFDFKPKSFRIEWSKAALLLKIGLPNSIQLTCVSMSFMTLTSLINSFGVVASAATGICSKVNSFAILPGVAMSSSVSSMAGQNIGARAYDRAKQTLFVGIRIGLGIGLLIFAIVNIFPAQILEIFTDDMQVVQTGVPYLRLASIEFFIAPIMFCLNGFATGSGYSSFAMINALVSSLILRVPLAFFFAKEIGMGLNGVGLAAALAPIGALITGSLFVRSNRWRVPRIDLNEEPLAESTPAEE